MRKVLKIFLDKKIQRCLTKLVNCYIEYMTRTDKFVLNNVFSTLEGTWLGGFNSIIFAFCYLVILVVLVLK